MEESEESLPDFLQAYVDTIKCSSSDLLLVRAMQKLKRELDDDRYKVLVGKPEVGLIPILINLVIRSEASSVIRAAINCLWYLSRANENKAFIASPEFELIPFLVNLVLTDNDIFQGAPKNILINCSLHPSNHRYLLSDSLGFMSLCSSNLRTAMERHVMFQDPFEENEEPLNELDVDLLIAVSNICSSIEKDNLHYLIQHRLHEMVLQLILLYGSDFIVWDDQVGGPEYWLLNTLVDLSRYEEGARAIVEIPWFREKASSFFEALLPFNKMEAVKALCVMSQLSMVYDDYRKYLSKLALIHPDLFALLMKVLKATVEREEDLLEIRFVFGNVSLKVITKTIKILCSLSPENTRLFLLHDLSVLLPLVDLYIINAPEVSTRVGSSLEFAGGGGKDEETLCNILEMIYICLIQVIQVSPELVANVVRLITNQQEKLLEIKMNELMELNLRRKIPERSVILCRLIQEII